MPSPDLGAGPSGLRGWESPRADAQPQCDMRHGSRFLLVGPVLGKVRIWMSPSSGFSDSGFGTSLGEGALPVQVHAHSSPSVPRVPTQPRSVPIWRGARL